MNRTLITERYELFCRERFPLPAIDDISVLENINDTRMPRDYVDFLLNYNGGYFWNNVISPSAVECPVDSLTTLAGVNTGHDKTDLFSERGYSPSMFENNKPISVLPIGYTALGSLIYISYDSPLDYFVGLKIAFRDNYFFLANSIDAFFELINSNA